MSKRAPILGLFLVQIRSPPRDPDDFPVRRMTLRFATQYRGSPDGRPCKTQPHGWMPEGACDGSGDTQIPDTTANFVPAIKRRGATNFACALHVLEQWLFRASRPCVRDVAAASRSGALYSAPGPAR